MSRLNWSKWFWASHSKKWRSHPLHIEGAWMRILEQLHTSGTTGEMSRPLSAWAMVIGVSPKETEEILDHIDRYNLASITFGDEIKIVSRRLIRDAEEAAATLKRQHKYKAESPTEARRADILKQIREAYHPRRAMDQPGTQQKELKAVMIAATKGKKKKECEEKEAQVKNKILDYIEKLKDTEEWINGGMYLQGLGKLLQSRAWESKIKMKNYAPKLEAVECSNIKQLWG